jgi:hypothetical protein
MLSANLNLPLLATEQGSSPRRERASMLSIRWPFLPASAQSVWADLQLTLV